MKTSILLTAAIISIGMLLAGCGDTDPENDDKVLKQSNPYSVAHNAINIALKGDVSLMLELAAENPAIEKLKDQEKLFASMDFVNASNPQKLAWGGITSVQLAREPSKTDTGLTCFHGTFRYSGKVDSGSWQMASDAPGLVTSCVAKTGVRSYAIDKLEFALQDPGIQDPTESK